MNEEIKNRIDGYLDAIQSSAQQAGEIIAEQTPLVAQEFLAWYFWDSVTFAIIALIVFSFTSIATYVGLQKSLEAIDSDSEMADLVPLMIFPVMLLILSGGFALENIRCAMKVSVAPRVVLLEEVSKLSR
jgi:hypothetical protein